MQTKLSYQESQRKMGRLACFGASLIHIILGSVYSWGFISNYIVAYYKHSDVEYYSYLNIDIAAVIFPLSTFLVFLTSPFGIRIGNAVGFSFSCSLFSVLLALSMLSASFVYDFWLFSLFFNFIPSLAMGFLSSESIYVVFKFYPEGHIINGLMMFAYSLGTCLTSVLAYFIINPQNLPFLPIRNSDDLYLPSELSDNTMYFVRILSVFYLVIGIIGSVLMKVPEFDSAFEDYQNYQEALMEKKEIYSENIYAQNAVDRDASQKFYIGFRETSEKTNYYNIKSVLSSWRFYHFVLLIFFSSCFGFFITNYFKIIGLKNINNDGYFLIVGCLNGFFGGFAKLISSLLLIKVNFKILFVCLIIVQLVFTPTMVLVFREEILFAVWNGIIALCHGAFNSIFPNTIFKTFGKGLWTQIYSFMLLAYAFSNIFQFCLAISFFDMIGVDNIFWIFFGMSMIGLILILIFKITENR